MKSPVSWLILDRRSTRQRLLCAAIPGKVIRQDQRSLRTTDGKGEGCRLRNELSPRWLYTKPRSLTRSLATAYANRPVIPLLAPPSQLTRALIGWLEIKSLSLLDNSSGPRRTNLLIQVGSTFNVSYSISDFSTPVYEIQYTHLENGSVWFDEPASLDYWLRASVSWLIRKTGTTPGVETLEIL